MHFNFSNSNDSGNGGAIDASVDSDMKIMYSHFETNRALNGGGVYHLGSAIIRESVFIENEATVSLVRHCDLYCHE